MIITKLVSQILVSVFIIAGLSASGYEFSEMSDNTQPAIEQTSCMEGEQSEHCITSCCYVMYTRTITPSGMLCEVGGTTHCSACCMTGTCLGESD